MTVDSLMAALGHAFSDRGLLQMALTHRSYGIPNNERLEFIGDGVLNCVIGLELFERFTQLREGDLTRLRATLVRAETLHGIAVGLDLGRYMRLGEGEVKEGGVTTPSILADAVEALIGAVYLDAGYDAAAGVISRLYLPLLAEIRPDKVGKDPKTRLQEWLQARKRPLPAYEVLEIAGAPPQQCFTVACRIDSPEMKTRGEGPSRRAAEQDAAGKALEALET
jgi:ribonuclease-3